jgi:hypothetical protein
MTSATKRGNARQPQQMPFLGFVGLMLLNIAVGWYWPGSTAATIVKTVYLSWVPIWLAFRIRAGYLRRRPYWTRDSWLRYLRLAVMPVVALGLVLFLASSFDTSASVVGAPRSVTRAVWFVIMLAMMLLGAIGLMVAIDWLRKGEPSEQFTRTRWFQRRRAPG